MLKEFFNLFKSDSLFEQALTESYNMLDIDLAMFSESVKSLRESNPGLKDKTEILETFLRKRLETMNVLTKQERGVGRTGKKTYYKVD